MNDMILNMLANDSFTVSDFKAVGLTAENTKLESEDKYKQSQMIQDNKLFQDDDGNFNDEIFHQYYLQATDFYNKLADDTYIDNITKNTFYSKDNLFAPDGSKQINETPKFVTSPNPFLQNNSITRVGKKGDRTLSISEIAQTQKVYDSESKTFREESVNDRAFGNNPFKWLEDIFSEPLVIAQWDEDGEHVDMLTGKVTTHKKGDYKYNDEGTFYYETLNGRDVYGKQVLNRMNTLTVDGSAANNYDFFDSDDLAQKSIVGNVMKNLALVGSMFLPVVGKPIIAASIATQSVGLLGALGKMFLGSENETVNNLHGWAKTLNRHNSTEYASQNTWCWENMINMIGDTVGQLSEQRFLFTHVPALFKGTKGINAKDTKTFNELVEKRAAEIRQVTGKDLNKAIEAIKTQGDDAIREVQELAAQHATLSQLKATSELEKYMASYNHLGSVLSKAYMTGITVQDTYGEAKANGASDLEAFALTLGYAAGEAWILNTGLGEWIMPELHGDKLKYKAIINALKNEVKPLTENAANSVNKEGRQNLFKQIFNIGKRIAKNDYATNQFVSKAYDPMKVVLAHAAGESFEEVSEELLADFSKSAFNIVGWLRGDDTRIAGAWENVIDRYGMSAIGGFLGGGISSVNTDFSYARQLGKMTNESAIQEIIYMVNNDKIDDFLKFANKADLGNKYLSTAVDENGNNKPGTKEDNQDREIKKMLNLQVQLIKDTIAAEGAKFSENALFDALTLKDLRYLQLRNTRTAGLMFQEYNSLISKIHEKKQQISNLLGENTNTDSKKKELKESEQEELKRLKDELKELRVQKDAIISGKRSPEFIATALYEAQQALHGHNRGYIFQEWVKHKTGKKFEELSKEEIEKLKPEYKAYRETEMKNDVVGDARQFVDLVGLATGSIQQHQEYVRKMLDSGKYDALEIQYRLGSLYDGINQALNEEDFDVDKFIEDTQNKLLSRIKGDATYLAKPLFNEETLKRLEYINSAPITPEYTEKDKNLDKTSVVMESLADYIDTTIDRIVSQNFVHPEVKNHLINIITSTIGSLENIKQKEAELDNVGDYKILKAFSAYRGVKEEWEASVLSDERGTMISGYIENLKSKIDQIKQLTHTPIVELLESFKGASFNSEISVKDVIARVNQLINQGYADISSVTYGEDLAKQIQEVDDLINVLNSVVYATRVDKAGINNSWGYSKTLNELNIKYGNDQWVKLAEIEGQDADLIQQDLALLKQKLRFAKNINSVNSGQKLSQQNKVGYNKHYIFFNKFKRLVNILPEKLKNWKLDSIQQVLQQDLILDKYNSERWDERKFSLTPEEKIKIEEEMLMVWDAIYNFFNVDNKDKLNNIDELAKFINPTTLYDPATNLLTDTVEDLDDNQFIFNLAAAAALKSSDFYGNYHKTFTKEKAPVPMQEQATFLNTAMVLNGDVINNFAKAYAKSVFNHFKELSEDQRVSTLLKFGYSDKVAASYAKNPELLQLDQIVEKFSNVVLTEGIAGSGKTEGVFDSTVKILNQVKPELLENAFVVSATLKHAQSLQEKLNLKGKVFSSKFDEKEHDLIKYFYSDYTSDYNNKIEYINGSLQTKFTLNKDLKNLPKVIFIDEVSRYDYIQMKLLSEAAQHYGIAILAAGDFDQISAEKSIKLELKKGEGLRDITFSPQRLNFIRSPKLGLSFRTLNSQMAANQKEVQANLFEKDKTQFNIHSWEDANEIRGFKVYDDSKFDDIVKSIEKIKKSLKADEKIGFLYANKDSELKKKLETKYGDLLDSKSIEDAQGLENNYYIIDINRSDAQLKETELQKARNEFYTAFTRAKKGGIIINNSMQKLKINEIIDEASEEESIKPEQIEKQSIVRKGIFDDIFKRISYGDIEYKELTKVERENIVVNTIDEDEGLPPSLPPSKPSNPPLGMYKDRATAENVDLSAYVTGYKLYDSSDNLVGTITGTTVIEHRDPSGITYYAPVINIKNTSDEDENLSIEEASKYTIKDPSTDVFVPKYKIGDIFYDSEGKPVEIIEVLVESDGVKYKIKKEDDSTEIIPEIDLNNYSLTPPTKEEVEEQNDQDLGENEDPETFRRRVEGANGFKKKQSIQTDGTIQHWMYTFNGYETGVLFTDDGEVRPEHFDKNVQIGNRTAARIDNINGLINLGKITPGTTKEQCLDVLATIHSILMHDTDNSSILSRISEITGIDKFGITLDKIEYGIKSSALASSRPDKSNKNPYGTKDEDSDYHVFDKHKDEKSEYSQPGVVEGDAISRKTIVAVFRDTKGKKWLEITLGTINSPLTIGQTVDENGAYIYPEIGALLETLTPESSSEDVFKVCNQAVKICQEKNWIDLKNLFKSFIFTSNAFAPLHRKGESFNLAQKLNYGPNIIKKKGNYQKDGTRQYEAKYVDLDQYVKNDNRIVTSKIFIPKTNEYGGKIYPDIHPGHAGVFVSFNKDYTEDQLEALYIQQHDPDYTGPKTVEFYYIIPPEATVKEYLRNYRNAYLNTTIGGTRSTFPIGNIWTSYKLLRNIYDGGELTETQNADGSVSYSLKSKLLNIIEFKDLIETIESLKTIENKTDWEGDSDYEGLLNQYKRIYRDIKEAKKYAIRNTILKKQRDILSSNFKNTTTPVYKIFTGYLANAAYWDSSEGSKADENAIALIEKYNKGTIKYQMTYTKEGDYGMFVPANVKDKYQLATIDADGNSTTKSCQINSKIDPPIYEFDALNIALGILADWEYEDSNNTNSRKVLGTHLRAGTERYKKNENSSTKPKNNFEILKENNNILFGDSGPFKDIMVTGVDDSGKDQIYFADQILTQFNSKPNNLGFAVVQPDRNVKLYAIKINEQSGLISLPEAENSKGMGKIKVNKSLIFSNRGSSLTFDSGVRTYNITLEGEYLKIDFLYSEEKEEPTEKVQEIVSNIITEEDFNTYKKDVINAGDRSTKAAFNSLSFADLLTLSNDDKDGYINRLKRLEQKDGIKALIDYLEASKGSIINVKVGDKISRNGSIYTVKDINGNNITLHDDSIVDITKEDIYKIDKKPIKCNTNLKVYVG